MLKKIRKPGCAYYRYNFFSNSLNQDGARCTFLIKTQFPVFAD